MTSRFRLARIARALAAACGLLAAACGPPQEERPLVVGMELAYPPFEMTDERNRPAGVSVEMARALGDFLDREIRIENIPFAGLIPALKTGKIDLVISSMTATEERAQSIAFSKPYATTGLCLLVAKDSPVQGIEDLDRTGRRVAVKQGTTGHIHAAENLRQARLLVFEKESSAVVEVVQGKADAFIYDQLSVYRHWRRHPEATRPLLEPFKKESWAVALRKEDEALRRQIDAFIDAFAARGGFERLAETYLAEQKRAFESLGVPFIFAARE